MAHTNANRRAGDAAARKQGDLGGSSFQNNQPHESTQVSTDGYKPNGSYVASDINSIPSDEPSQPSASYVASDIKRFRRTKAAITDIKTEIVDILSKDNPQTVRQVFYALTVRGVIKKEEIEYQRTVVRLLTDMREAEVIPFEWITDNTRLMRKPASFTSLDSCLRATSDFYRRNLWSTMPVYVEVWCEKDALSGVLVTETEVYDVPLMTARGYSSISFLYSAAKTIKAQGKPAYIYHFGDLDPSGVDAARDIETKLRRYAAGAEIHFERPAVTRQQVEEWNLPTRPTKMTDSRAKKFGSATSVELDAIPALKLRELVRECIERHVDKQQLALLRIAEESERGLLTKWAGTLNGNGRRP
jgi:hypothetical protein